MSDTFPCDLRLALENAHYKYVEGTNGSAMDKNVMLGDVCLYRLRAKRHASGFVIGTEFILADKSHLSLMRFVGWRKTTSRDELRAAIPAAERVIRQAWVRLGCIPSAGDLGPLTRIVDAEEHG